jgi:reverse gyrase
MIWFKSCPKCSGDLTEEREAEGVCVVCIQCGRELTEAEEVVLRYQHSAPSPAKVNAGAQRDLVAAGR